MDFKNVQRRVYDALNVLSALYIIRKDRNRIKFRGGPYVGNSTSGIKGIQDWNKLINSNTRKKDGGNISHVTNVMQ